MKKTITLLLALMLMLPVLPAFADTEHLPSGIATTQDKYADLISEAIEKSEYDEEQIDKEHIYIIENTSPIPMRKNEDPVWFWVALPLLDSNDVSYAYFDKGVYGKAITNFTTFAEMEKPYGNTLKQHIDKNNLSEPTEITNMWIVERLHLFAYNVVCDDKEYIIPYHFTEDSMFNLTNAEECNIEIGKAYTKDDFLTICEKEAELFAEYRKSESEQEEDDSSKTYVDNDGEIVLEKPVVKEESNEEISLPAKTYTFGEITNISAENVKKISVACSKDGRTEFSTLSPLMITNIINSVKDTQFTKDISEGGGAGGWVYFINFYMTDGNYVQYGSRLYIDKINYIATDSDASIETMAYYHNLMKNTDSSAWAADYILECIELGFLDVSDNLSFQAPITREKFCEIVYNMLTKTTNKSWSIPTAVPFKDTNNTKVATLYYEDIIKGKSDDIFAPNDHLTREEAATILYRVAEYTKLEMPQSTYNESVSFFSDKNLISDWAFDAVFYINEMGIMVGTSNTNFSPQETYTAEQAIATIIRLYNY